MTDEPTNEALAKAIRQGKIGVGMVAIAVVWVFVRPEGTPLLGIAEVLAFLGMVTALGAVFRAADATSGEGR